MSGCLYLPIPSPNAYDLTCHQSSSFFCLPFGGGAAQLHGTGELVGSFREPPIQGPDGPVPPGRVKPCVPGWRETNGKHQPIGWGRVLGGGEESAHFSLLTVT